ncbi:MAG: hypothetical protein AAGB46_19820 [Verrucomicrobiota bacterium]
MKRVGIAIIIEISEGGSMGGFHACESVSVGAFGEGAVAVVAVEVVSALKASRE